MRDNLIPVIVGRKWQIANGYHAVELRTTSRSALPPFNDGACITLCLNSAGDKERIYPLLGVSSHSDGYVVGTRYEAEGRTDSLLSRFPLNERDEVFIGFPKNQPTILDDRVRSILFAGGIGAASIAGIAKRLASAGQRFEVHNFARSADRAVLREALDALRDHGKVYHHFGLSDDLFAQKSSHAMSPTHANTQIYCSGPPAFMDLIERQAREWVYAANVHKIALGDQTACSTAVRPRDD
ncbi:oxidoreductase [Paraburkholderia sp. Tr-20389]|uniref:oxidoreductase n=1 Tax=Paraburkholderia sp. Tr-20389 TaxID=2703903 RepID=UPI00197F1F36|nr:oxidoreductase [Paraburkholderia sp. Tr-20389]MBN3752298.1 oxidoreductase [Paraburkholderia sp. Tr-20389]